jgi:uncharacterized membrane protein YkvA (DUF1232 family)
MVRTYIDYLREEIDILRNSGEDFDRSLLHFPDLVQLLCDLLDNELVDKESRVHANIALGYLVIPNDMVPEEVYGAYGYIDDMYVSCIILSNLRVKYYDLISSLWDNTEEFDKVLDFCKFSSEKFLEEKNLKEKLLIYCGLSE